MPVEFHWLDDDHTLSLWTLGKSFTWEEWETASQLSLQQGAHDAPRYSIVDASRIDDLPDNILSALPRIAATTPDNLRFSVIVGLRPGLVQSVAHIFASVFGRMRFALTVEAAHALIAADRAG